MKKFDEKDWRARDDADVLLRAYEIESDVARYKIAKKAMKKQVDEQQKALENRKKIIAKK